MENNDTPVPAPESPTESANSSKTLPHDDASESPSSYGSDLSLYAADLLDDSEPLEFEPMILDSNVGDSSRWKPPSDGLLVVATLGAGFSNLRNTCFMNAVLQCLIHTVPLLVGLISNRSCDCKNNKFCILGATRQLVNESLTVNGSSVTPQMFADNLSEFSSEFQKGQQEDAHEFLTGFIDILDTKHCNSATSQTENLKKQVFGGRLLSKLKCSSCGHCSDTYEASFNLSLEIENADDLTAALQSYTKIEKIMFTCEECKEQVFVEKQFLFDQAPSVASFHLKRYKRVGIHIKKIDRRVAFPKELDLLPFTGGNISDKELKYELYAIVVHDGFTPTSGHYTCFIRVSPDMWYKYDDSKVDNVPENVALSQEAYILFYAKEGTMWFSTFIEAHKSKISTIFVTSPKSLLDSVETPTFLPLVQEKTGSVSDQVSVRYGPEKLGVGKEDCLYSRPKHKEPESNESPVDLPSRKVVSPSLLDKTTWTQEATTFKNITPQTPPRSPSPEIYRIDPSGYALLPLVLKKHIESLANRHNLDDCLKTLELVENELRNIAKPIAKPVEEVLHELKETLVLLLLDGNKELKAGAAICIGEILFIFAPNYPFRGDQSKLIFSSIAQAFKTVSSFNKGRRTKFLDTMAKCRYYHGMVALKLKYSISVLFAAFLDYLRGHQDDLVAFTCMKTIMIGIFDHIHAEKYKGVGEFLHKQLRLNLEKSKKEKGDDNYVKLVEQVIEKCKNEGKSSEDESSKGGTKTQTKRGSKIVNGTKTQTKRGSKIVKEEPSYNRCKIVTKKPRVNKHPEKKKK